MSGRIHAAAWSAAVLALAATAAPASAQWTVRASGLASVVHHRVDAGYGVEPSDGVVFGTEVRVGAGRRFAIQLMAQGGSLEAQEAGALSRDLAEVGARLDVATLSWLTLQAGVGSRTFSTVLARQTWTMISLGAEARVAFSGRGVSGMARGAFLPGVSVSGLDGPDLAFTGAAGMEYRPGHGVFALLYSLERYTFPAGASPERREQLVALTLTAGWRFR